MYLTAVANNVKHATSLLDILCVPQYLFNIVPAMGWR